MKKSLSLLAVTAMCLLYVNSRVNAQDTLKTSVYFEFNKSDLPSSQKQRLDSLVVALGNREVIALRITANTDTKGSIDYNQKLSDMRARVVYQYLYAKGITTAHQELLSQGKTAPTIPGADEISRAKNRRTDIELIVKVPELVQQVSMPVSKEPVIKTSNSSTSQKVQLVYPPAILKPYKNSDLTIQYNLQSDMGKLARNGYTTMSTEGNILTALGIFELSVFLKDSHQLGDNTRFSEGIIVRIPVKRSNLVQGNVLLWEEEADSAGNIFWKPSGDSVRKIIDGLSLYYEFTVLNPEKRLLGATQTTRLQRLATHRFNTCAVKCVYAKSGSIILAKNEGTGNLVIDAPLTHEIPRIYATATDKDNVRYTLNGKRLSDLKKNLFTGIAVLRPADFKRTAGQRIKKVNKSVVTFGFNK